MISINIDHISLFPHLCLSQGATRSDEQHRSIGRVQSRIRFVAPVRCSIFEVDAVATSK